MDMGPCSADDGSLGFGFNHAAFSDRVVNLEIISGDHSEGGVADQEVKRLHINSLVFASKSPFFYKVYSSWLEPLLLPFTHSECGADLQLKKLHINSLVLASKSPFFYKLFTNGMKESDKKEDVTLRINASEEAALMAADKFEVNSCIRHCVEVLLKVPMSVESVLFYLQLPSTVLEGEIVQPLICTAKQYLAALYGDFTQSQQEEAMALPLSAIEAVIGSHGLRVDSEDAVYDFMLKWARFHYPKVEERREILTKHFVSFICFPNMSSLKLKEVLACADFDYDQVVNRLLKALFFKIDETPECGYPTRIYNTKPIKVVNFGFSPPGCVVYLGIKKDPIYTTLFPAILPWWKRIRPICTTLPE